MVTAGRIAAYVLGGGAAIVMCIVALAGLLDYLERWRDR